MVTDSEIIDVLSTCSGYARYRLGMEVSDRQAAVMDSLFMDRRAVLRAGNAVGKTSCILVAITLYAIEILNAQVVGTSATYRQITSQFMPAARRYAHLFPSWEFQENTINIGGDKRFIGFSTVEESTWQGYHEYPGRPLLIWVDEAAGIKESIFRAIDRCHPTYYLMCGSPLGPEGEFYNVETKPEQTKYFKHFKITAFDCPWIKKEDIKMLIDKWGNEHPLVQSSVYAEFSKNSEFAIIQLGALENCIKYPPVLNELSSHRRVFIDVAAGGDADVIALCHKNKVSIIKRWHNRDTMSAAGEILIELQKLKKNIGLIDREVSIDADGLGIGIANRLQELGWTGINLFHGNAAPQDEKYANLIAEVWISGCKQIEDRQVIIPDDTDLRYQLLSRQQKITSTGKLKLESKQDMKDRGISSPDSADAVMGCMYAFGGGCLTFAQVPIKKRETCMTF